MAAAFSQSLRSLESDASRRPIWLLAGVLGLGVWTAWLFGSRVSLYEVSSEARLEVDRDVHPVTAQVAGRVVLTRLALGREVNAGDVLVELDSEIEHRRVEEERRRLAAVAAQLAALKRETSATDEARLEDEKAARSALEGARARQKEAEVASRFADEEARRLAQLKEGLAELERLRFRAEEQKKAASSEALTLDVRRREFDERAQHSEGRAHQERLARDIALLEGELSTGEATLSVLEETIERHHVRAPAAGKIGEVATLQIGAFLQAGDRVATVIPAGELRAVASFPPTTALGHIHPGQTARLRLDGFPWTEFGTVAAQVTRVASEVREGRLRVELKVLPAPGSRIPMQHGLPGVVEVEVERVSPASLVLRSCGQLMSGPISAPSIVGARNPDGTGAK